MSLIVAPLVPVEALVEDRPALAAQRIATTCERALTLRADGYQIVPTQKAGVYEVHKPAKVNKKTGEITEFDPYIVDICAQTCTCEQYLYHGHCKHERATRQAVLEALALLLPGGGR